MQYGSPAARGRAPSSPNSPCTREDTHASVVSLVVPPVAPAPSQHETAAKAIIAVLLSQGVDTFFGIPGGPVSPIFDAVLQHPNARLIESRHESGAAFAAASYFRSSGKVPAVIVTAGPGATNAITGVASAFLGGVPMLVICGDVAWAARGGKLLQDSGPAGLAVEEMFARITRAQVRVSRAESAATQALSALAAACRGPVRGPALLVVPMDHALSPAKVTRVSCVEAPRPTRPDRQVVEEICRALVEARRPLIVLGAGARPYAAELRKLVDSFDVPFVTTPQAKGLVSERHPRSLRQGGLGASMWARRYTADGVDACLALGTDLDDCAVGPTPYIAPTGKLYHVDVDAGVFNRNHPTEIGVVADVGAFCEVMREVLAEHGFMNGAIRDTMRELRASSPFEREDFMHDESLVIAPHRAVADIVAAVDDDAAFISDIGEHMLFALHYLTADGPDQFHIQLNLGSMGSGISGAIGLALAHPKRQVVCICGDGGMQMSGMEALVALQERLPIVYAVFNDARYNMVYHGYKSLYGRDAPWQTPPVDFAEWARALGIPGIVVHRPGELTKSTLARLLAHGGPVVLDIRIDREVRLKAGGRNEALRRMSVGEGDIV